MLPVQKNKDIGELVSRLVQRIQKINSVEQQFINYIYKLQKLYGSYGNKITEDMMQLQQQISGMSLYSSEKSIQILKLCRILKELGVSVGSKAEVNLLNLRQVGRDKVLQQQQKLQKKSQIFLEQFHLYIAFEYSYNSKHYSYIKHCSILNNLLLRYQNTSDPINFYNETASSEYLKDLESKYNICSNKQTDLLTEVQVLDQKRKWLGEHLKEVTDSYVALLHNHLVRIQNVAVYVTDYSKNTKVTKEVVSRLECQNVDHFDIQEMQRLDNAYKKPIKCEDDMFGDFSDLVNPIQASSISSDYKFFLDRCIDFTDKKLKYSKETLAIKNRLLKQFHKIMVKFIQFEDEFHSIEKQVYGINRVDNHKKRFKKYFGDNLSQVQQLCFIIIERPKKSFQKILNAIKSQELKMQKICQVTEENIDNFQKRTKHIFNQHSKIKQKTQALNEIDGPTFQKYKTSVITSFNEFKLLLSDLQCKEQQFNKHFQTAVQSFILIISKEVKGVNLQKILEKQTNRFNILKILQIDSEVISIIKSDIKYQILFSEALKPDLNANFASAIENKKYQQTKKVLQKKQAQSKIIARKQINCCGISSEPANPRAIAKYSCSVMVQKDKISGQLSLLAKGLRFKEKTYNPFKKQLNLIIPQKQISEIETKVNTQANQNLLSIITSMGPITLVADNTTDIKENIKKNLSLKNIKDGAKDKSIDKRDKKNQSSLSFLKLNTSTQYKLSFDEGNNSPTKPNYSKKSSAKLSTDKKMVNILMEKLRHHSCFNNKFIPSINPDKNKSNMVSRIDYQFEQNNIKMKIKQKREFKMSEAVNFLFLNIQWKVSFPQFQLLSSYKFSEQIRLEIKPKLIKINIEKDKFTEDSQFLKKKFYQEVIKMNDALCQYIMTVCEREVEVCIKEESSEEEKTLEFIYNSDNQQHTDIKIDNGDQFLEEKSTGLKFKQRNSLISGKINRENSYKQ